MLGDHVIAQLITSRIEGRLPIYVRLTKVLIGRGFTYWEEVAQLTVRELLSFPGVGRKTLAEAARCLSYFGLSFRIPEGYHSGWLPTMNGEPMDGAVFDTREKAIQAYTGFLAQLPKDLPDIRPGSLDNAYIDAVWGEWDE